MPHALLLVIAGLALLVLAADRFVLSAVRLASHWGMSTMLIGALVVGMGTSAPEFIVSVVSGGESFDLAIGNIVGSNIANLSLVLGASILVATIVGQQRILRREGIAMLASMVLFSALIWDGSLGLADGIILIAAMLVASFYLVRWSRQDNDSGVGKSIDELETGESVSAKKEIALGIGTLIVMLLGAEWLKDGALEIAQILGISAGAIGLTLVAIGTSLPELATVIAAARRRENGLVVGNLVGSNLFNSLVVGGGVALVRPGTLESSFTSTLVAMLLIGGLAGILGSIGNRFVRAEGAGLLALYLVYLVCTF
jgi:cation:H+ antiporter